MRVLKEIHTLIGNYHVKSGVYHYYRDEYKQAVEFLRKALRDEDSLSESDVRNARHYLTLTWIDSAAKRAGEGDLKGAEQDLQRGSEVSPRFPDIHFRRGRVFERLGRTDAAIAAYQRAIECNGEYLEAQVALGFCLLGAGQDDRAAEAFDRARELKAHQLDRPFRQAQEALRQGDGDRARELFHETFLAVPQLAAEYVKKALDWLKDEEFERALVDFERALELSPNYPDLHNYRGIALCELERHDDAIAAFALSVKLGPRYLVPRLNLAFTHVRAGNFKEAEVELESVLELDPTEPAATAMLEELKSGRAPEKRRPVSRGATR